jgi:thiamine transport system permease protein
MVWLVPCALFARDYFTLSSLAAALSDTRAINVIAFTFKQAVLSTIVSFIVAIVPALYAGRGGKLSPLVGSTLFIPFFFPSIACIVSFAVLFSPGGLLAHAGINTGLMYTLPGILVAHSFYNAPIFVKYLSDAFRSVPRDLAEDARTNGAGRFIFFIKVVFPLALPSAARAAFLVFSFCFMSFAVILGIGGMAYSTMEVEIATVLRGSMDFSRALSLGLVQCVIICAVALLSHGVRSYELPVDDQRYNRSRVLLIGTCIYLLFEFGIVGAALVVSVFNPFTGLPDLSPFAAIVSSSFNEKYPVWRSLANTSIVSAAGAAVSVAVGYFFVKKKSGILSSLVLSTIGISSAFLAISFVYTGVVTGIPSSFLLCAGLICVSVPLSFSFMKDSFSRFDSTLVDEARMTGAGTFHIFRRIEFPLLAPSFIAAFLQSFAVLFGEFTLSYTMQIQDSFPLLPITVFSMQSARLMRESSALSSVSVCIVIAVYIISMALVRRADARR